MIQFTKTAADHNIPGLIDGNPGSSCQNCYHFSFPRNQLPLFDQGVNIVGMCDFWNEHVGAFKKCGQHVEGEPDAR